MSQEQPVSGIFAGPIVQELGLPEAAKELRSRQVVAPGMLSFAERAMLTQLARARWAGEGAIIDGGSFFGSSVAALAEGLLAGQRLDDAPAASFPEAKPIHAYELGYLPAPASPSVERRREFGGLEYFLGESFVPILEETVQPYRDLVCLHIGDLLEESWPGSPIEIAFIDVCKTARLNAHVSTEFYPFLVPGASTLINQDFFFDRLPWIKVTMGHLEEYFSWEGRVASSSIYRNVKAVPPDVAAFDPFSESTVEECLTLHDAVQHHGIDRRGQFMMILSRCYLMALKGWKDEALDELRAVATTYADLLGDLDNPRGNQFRLDRAERQIANGAILKVS